MRKKKLCLSRLLPVIAALLVLVMFRTVFILGYVPTNSMKPTLEAGSLILGVRIKGSFEVGDVVIFCRGGNLFVKRIAAVGGNVVMHNGINMSVPEGSYYMLGDNADDSYDSRYWDDPFVPVTTVVADGRRGRARHSSTSGRNDQNVRIPFPVGRIYVPGRRLPTSTQGKEETP